MDRRINKTEGQPLVQFPSGSTFSHVNHTTVPAVEDHTNCKFQSPADSYNLAVEILNTFTSNRPDKFLPGHPLFDALLGENSARDLQAVSPNLLSLLHTLPDTALREHTGFPSHVGRAKSLDAVQPSITLSTNRGHEDPMPPALAMGCYNTETHLGSTEEALNRIAHWSNTFSSTSPSSMAAFQHALTHLAVLGLSSPSPSDARDTKRTGNEATNMLGSNLEAINLSYNNPMDNETVTTKNGISPSMDVSSSSGTEPLNNKVESGSKVIIRQTADADEHFFKALRRLKVDVSMDTQTTDKSSMGLIVIPDSSTLTSTKSDEAGVKVNKTDSTNRCEQPRISKSATELAVEEHFEKSLAAFHASNLSKQLLSEKLKTNFICNKVPLPESTGTSCCNNLTTTTTPTATSGPANFTLQHQEENIKQKVRYLVRQYAQDPVSPIQGSEYLSSVEPQLSRSFTSPESDTQTFNPDDPAIATSGQIKRESTIDMTTGLCVNGQTRVQKQFAASIAAAAANSFKPKKNWLAQYDWRQDVRGKGKMSRNTPNGLTVDSLDSAESSPALLGAGNRDQPDVLATNTFRGLPTNTNQTIGKITRVNGAREHEVSVQTTESVGLSTEDRSIRDQRVRHSAEIQTDAGLIKVLSNMEGEEESSADDEAFAEDTRPRKIILLEKNKIDRGPSRSRPDQARRDDSPNQSGYPTPKQGKRNSKALRIDLALSPISQEHGVTGESIVLARSNSNDQTQEDKVQIDSSDRVSPKMVQDPSSLVNQTKTNSRNRDIQNCNRQHPKSCWQWGLSNSCSPSPAHQDGSATSAVTPVSGTTSGFFTGSTFSLDSSLGPTHALPFDTREVDSGIDLKLVSEERSFADKKPSSESNDLSRQTNDETDLPGCLWGMRKRASSEASPWSTLKRSRSVLTSPLSGRVNCASCSSSSAELLLESHGTTMTSDEPMDASSRFPHADTNGTHRHRCEGVSRSLTPELDSSNTRERLLMKSRQNFDPIDIDSKKDETKNDDGRMPSVSSRSLEIYPLYHHHIATERKPASEPPPVISKPSGIKSISRSQSDAAVIPTIHLKKENELFVLR